MEVFIIWLIALSVGLPIMGMKFHFKQKEIELKEIELERERLGAGGGMTLGELKRVLREVVEEANEPVLRRLDALERLALPAAREAPPRETAPYGDMDLEPAKTVGRRELS
jgi:hypothetical protein